MSNVSHPPQDCFQPRQAVSNGVFQGDNPVNFAVPLLVIQICLVLAVTRSLAFLIRPLRQPRVLAEIIGGVLLGPSALGRNKYYLEKIFPKPSITVLDTAATLGLLFFLFMVGLELDLKEIRKSGRNALVIAIAGIGLPFVAGVGISSLMYDTIAKSSKFAPLVVFVGVPISITAFPVLVRILAERKLLTTDIGRLVLPAAAINDVLAWILLALGVALSGPSNNPGIPAFVLLCGIAFVVFMLTVARPFMEWIALRASNQQPLREIYVCIALMGVLTAGFTTDAIGIHPLFGAFVFGLIVPKEGNFAVMLIEKIEDFITVLMLPLFFASSGLKTNLGTINSARSFGFLILVIGTAGAGKISATYVLASAQGMPKRKALTLGFLMNTKGLVELIVLNIGKDLKVLNDETFAILVLMCLLTTFVTTPVVMALYKPARNPKAYTTRNLQFSNMKVELRILACIHGTRNIPATINLIESFRGIRKRQLKLFILHLVELSDRPSVIMIATRTKKNSSRQTKNGVSDLDKVFVAFEAYGQLSKVTVRPLTAISDPADMHKDVCSTAADRRAVMILLPYHKHPVDGMLDVTNPVLRTLNQKVLQHAPCSVGIFVDRGLGEAAQLPPSSIYHKVAVLFFGGPDDREALAFGCQLAEHPGVRLSIIRFLPGAELDRIVINLVPPPANQSSLGSEHQCTKPEVYRFSAAQMDDEKERNLDEESLSRVKQYKLVHESTLTISFIEQMIDNPIEAVISIGKTNDFDLFLVGRGRYPAPLTANLADQPSECPELGPIGDVLASTGSEIRASVLVIQHHEPALSHEAQFTKFVDTSTPKASDLPSSSPNRGDSLSSS